MSLYKYKKTENYTYDKKEYLKIDEKKSNRANAWNTTAESYSLLQRLVQSSTLANFLIPSLFIGFGLFFIWQYIYPEIKTEIEKSNGQVSQGTVTLASENFIDRAKFISNPAGLSELSAEAFNQNILQRDSISKNYSGVFYLTIPALNIKSMPVQANVDSTTESIYNTVLKNSLAHFQNTGLPISEIQNNIVIYGHSASPSYGPKRDDPEVAFSYLSDLKVGDEIFIDMDGKTYKYRMYRSKIVEPTDLSIITGKRNSRTLTLFTCYPAGNNKSRYVAVAKPIN